MIRLISTCNLHTLNMFNTSPSSMKTPTLLAWPQIVLKQGKRSKPTTSVGVLTLGRWTQ